MSQRTSPRTSGVHRACIAVHRACPSPPLYPPVRGTHAHGLYGPCACHTKLAQAECGAARRDDGKARHAPALVTKNKRISGLLPPFLAYPKKDRPMYDRQDLRWDGRRLRRFSSRGVVLATVEPDKTWPGMWRVRLPDGHFTDMMNLSRVMDAAASLALGVLNQRREVA
jgi:hypothetical protein